MIYSNVLFILLKYLKHVPMNLKLSLYTAVLLSSAPLFANAQTTPRIIGSKTETFYNNVLDRGDSTRVVYKTGNTNGGGADELNNGTLKCDTLQYFRSASATAYAQHTVISNVYNSAGLMDTQFIHNDVGKEMIVTEYNSANAITRVTEYNNYVSELVWTEHRRTLNTYTGSNLTVQEEQKWNIGTGSWQPDKRNTYTYAGNTKQSDTLSQHGLNGWNIVQYAYYTYNAANDNDTIVYVNHLNTGVFEIAAKYEVAYNSAHAIVGRNFYAFGQNSGGSVISNGLKYMAVLDGANRVTNDTNWIYDMVGGFFWINSVNDYYYNTAGLCDTMLTYVPYNYTPGNPLDSNLLTLMYYNGAQQLTKKEVSGKNTNTSGWGDVYKRTSLYHYAFPTGIDNKTTTIAEMKVYPNPANDVVNISVKQMANRPYIVTIHNSTGAVMRQWEEKDSNNRMVPVVDLQAGNYIVTIRSGSDVQHAQFVIAR